MVFSYLATLAFWSLTIYEWIIIIAIVLSWVSPDPTNPVVQFLNSMTRPLWNRLSAMLPSVLRLFSAYVSLLLVWFLKIFIPGVLNSLGALLQGSISAAVFPGQVLGFFLLGLGIVTQNLFYFLIMLLLIWFVLTLVSPSINNPIVLMVYRLVDPFLTPIQKRLPRSRYDFSPLVAAGIFMLLNALVIGELIAFAAGLTRSGMATMVQRSIF